MVLKATVIFTFKEALLCIPPFFYSVPPCSVWKHQRRVETKFSLSLWWWALSQFRWVHTRVLICTTDRAHQSWMRTAFLASWQCARVHTWITSRWFYLFCFFHLFPRNLADLSRRWYDASRCILESVRLFLPPSSCFSRNYSRLIVRHLSFVFDDYRLVFPLSFNYSLETERTNYNASQLNAPSSKKGALACLFISRII